MKILNLIGLYTKSQYLEALIKAKAYGYQTGRAREKNYKKEQLLEAQLTIDNKNYEIEYLHKQIANNELDLQCMESEIYNMYDEKIYRLETLQKRVKSYKKKRKIANRINELELKKLEI